MAKRTNMDKCVSVGNRLSWLCYEFTVSDRPHCAIITADRHFDEHCRRTAAARPPHGCTWSVGNRLPFGCRLHSTVSEYFTQYSQCARRE